MLYTGGTTGNPKGVVWRHVDLFGALGLHRLHDSRCRCPDNSGRSRFDRSAAPGRGQEPGHAVRAAADARHGAVPRDRRVRDGRHRWCCSVVAPSMPTNCGTSSSSNGVTQTLAGRRCVRPSAQRGARRIGGGGDQPRPRVGRSHRVDRGNAVGRSEACVPAPTPERDDLRHDRGIGGRPVRAVDDHAGYRATRDSDLHGPAERRHDRPGDRGCAPTGE